MAKIVKQLPEEMDSMEVQPIEPKESEMVNTEWLTNSGHCIAGDKVQLDKETYLRFKNKGLVK